VTAKTLTFVCIEPPFFSNRMSGKKSLKINKYYKGDTTAWRDFDDKDTPYRAYMNNGHVARFWPDGAITVYPNQCGIPHILTPLSPEL
jgi:hypothetical protein